MTPTIFVVELVDSPIIRMGLSLGSPLYWTMVEALAHVVGFAALALIPLACGIPAQLKTRAPKAKAVWRCFSSMIPP